MKKQVKNAAKATGKSGKSVSNKPAKAPIKLEYEKRWLEPSMGKATITEKDGQFFLNIRQIPITMDVASSNGKSMLFASSRGNVVLQEEGSTAKKRIPMQYDAEEWQSDIVVSFNCFAVIPKEFRVGTRQEDDEE